MRKESVEQEIVISWCNIQSCAYKELELIHHVPNGGKRNRLEAAALKRQGVKAGVPDLSLPVARNNFHGLYIEMKVGSNTCTDNQKEWLRRLKEEGYMCKVCYGADEAIGIIKEYLNIKERW
ncbi:hypothetical protein TPDSL_13810 [Terrisporobacter petrolearius]|uniref:VRR-NUC domain-containing protein n=1 Tax=Terrisporobacter petrolearius TaxID=1460447 RepID=UPI00336898C0